MIPSFTALRGRLRMRHLQLLQALAEKGSLRGAADVICMSQPAATKALQELEDLVGVGLFIRHPRGLVPTSFGEALTRYANTVLEDLKTLQHELKAVERGEIGRVRIGTIMAAAPGLLTRSILALRASHPRLELTVQVDTSDILVRDLEHGLLDIVIGRIPKDWSDEPLTFVDLAAESLSVVARVGHPVCALNKTAISELRDCTWILQPHPSPMRDVIEQLFRAWGDFQPAAIIETSSTLTTLTLIRESDMIGVLPEVVGSYFVNMGLISALPLEVAAKLPPYGLITRQNREDTPAMQKVAETIIREANIYYK